jgi:N utilization substance protein B
MLFQVDLAPTSAAEVFPEFWSGQPASDDVRQFAESLVAGVSRHCRGIDRILAAWSENWRLERMAVVDRNVLRMAVYEMVFIADTPAAVVIDEAIEVAKRFGGGESGAFINGILDAVRRGLERGEIAAPPAD